MTPRTVLLASPYFPPDLGGLERYVWNLARLLRSRHGHRVVIATTASRGTQPGRYDGPDGIPVYRLPAPARISHTPVGPHWSRRLHSIIEGERADLVNAHAPVPLFADAAARACGALPFVLTYHTGRMRKGRVAPDLVCATYERTMLARTAARAQEIVCSSDCVAAELPALFGGRSTTISPGVDPESFPASPVPDAPRIVFVGSLERAAAHKGLPDLLRALASLTPAFPDVHLDVVGTGSAAVDHEALAQRLGIAPHVTFQGRLEGEDLAAAYRDARVLALPTHFDSFPCVLVEAMACGRPVVTTHVGGIPSLVTHDGNGLLVAPGSEERLAEALGSVLADHALAQRLGSAGHEYVARELTWERQSDRTVDVFDRASDRSRRACTVAVVAPNYPPRCGGVEHYAARVARAVAEDPAMRAAVITASTTGWRTSVGIEHGVPVVRLGTWARHLNTPVSPLWPLQLRRWLHRLRVDVVNAHAPAPGLGDLAVAVSGKRPTVMTYHAGSMLQGHKDVDLLVHAYERHVLPRVFRRADALVASSPVSLAHGRPGAVQITPGVDVERFTPGPPASARPRTVLYVGRMDRASPWKGIDVLLRAFAALSDLPEARLRLVGSGDALAEHRALAERLGIIDRVEFTGRVPEDILLSAMRNAAVLVLPSRTAAESFGMVLVEAMACGTPVVGSDAGGIPHVITDGVTGLLFPHDDPDALAAACRRLLRDGELADRLGGAGRCRAVERYAWPALTDQYLRLFRSLAADRDGGQSMRPATASRRAPRAGFALPSARRRP
ncbi:glycosyltransferase family 1 protein [Streptomyces cyaneochromogenes]|uniref:Glycosyltransferase family 1 protein n=1 Tax=Streptomyces cyaneochromogenes TaxID=2496836 RepID=A0A3Q9EZI4_9ACTN|nr:glycosyltransferase family 4 protein [Streptomyces cyaneochromogenes]AZQ39043.1 glycosyltransferase family 1 protein [Streptomyces cyaneochromogenes]